VTEARSEAACPRSAGCAGSRLRGRHPAPGRLQHLEQRRRLVEPEHAAELAGRLQRRRAPRLQRHDQIARRHADTCAGGAIGRGDPAQVLLDLVYRLPGGGEGAAQVEQELLQLAQLPPARPRQRTAWRPRYRVSALTVGYGPLARQQIPAPRPRS
jgi:hypothetical protein